LKAGSLGTKHFGKDFRLVDGTKIGALTKISRVETTDGLEFKAEFDGLDFPVTDPSIEMMYSTPRAEPALDPKSQPWRV
jgi:hypothetical protein